MKQKIYILLSLLLTFLLSFPSFAMSPSSSLDLGGIKISIDTYMLDEIGKKKEFDYDTLFPGQEEEFIIEVTSMLNKAWIRVMVINEINGEPIDIETISNLQEDWIKCGDYYYLTTPIGYNETSIMSDHIKIPEELLGTDAKISIKTYAEAVQEFGFTPDFESLDPFKGLLIESTSDLNEESWNDAHTKEEGPIETVFDSHLNSIISNMKLFLAPEYKVLLPGQVMTDSFTITNNSNSIIKIKMMTEKGEFLEHPEMKKIMLEIRKDGTLIYKDSLINSTLDHGIILGTFQKNSKSVMDFTIIVPKEITNDLATQRMFQKWIFDVEEIKGKNAVTSNDSTTAIDNIVYENPDVSLKKGIDGGKWILIDSDKHLWHYQFSDGTLAKDGWIYVRNPYHNNLAEYSWYHFGKKAYMSFGWVKSKNDNWYYGHSVSDGDLGTLIYGWHHDSEDGRSYYLDPITGIMQSGWKWIDGNYYYFARLEDTYKQNWFWNTSIGRWLYDRLGDRPYGAMFKNEKTPDGYSINNIGTLEDI